MKSTYDVVEKWFRCLSEKKYEEYYRLIDDNIKWVNLRVAEGINDCLPWLGTFNSKEEVLKSYEVFGKVAGLVEGSFVLHDIYIDGEFAISHIHEEMRVHETGRTYAIDGMFKMQVKDGKVVYWESFWDPSAAIKAVRG